MRAQDLASKIGIPNLLQPGLVKEMIISEILGHELITSKRDAERSHVGFSEDWARTQGRIVYKDATYG